jgi:hypothetical protein
MSGGLTADWWLMDVPRLGASKDCDMKKKLLVLLIAAASTLMPNFASAIAIDIEGEIDSRCSRGTDCFFGD